MDMDDNKMKVNADFILMTIQIVGAIAQKLEKFKTLKNVKEVRQTGMIAAVELKDYDVSLRVNLKVFSYALEKGVLFRPLGNVVYFMPPFIITCKEIDTMMDVAYEAIVSLDAL